MAGHKSILMEKESSKHNTKYVLTFENNENLKKKN